MYDEEREKAEAYEAWKGLPDGQKQLLMESLKNYAKSEEVENGDIMRPADFIRSGYWLKWVRVGGRT